MRTETVDGVTVLIPRDDHLDASNRDDFRASLEAAIDRAAAEGKRQFVLDLMNVRFVDSSGLGVMMAALRRLRGSDCDMVACNIAKPVKVLFDLVRLDRVMSVYADRAAAVASYAASAPGADGAGGAGGAGGA